MSKYYCLKKINDDGYDTLIVSRTGTEARLVLRNEYGRILYDDHGTDPKSRQLLAGTDCITTTIQPRIIQLFKLIN